MSDHDLLAGGLDDQMAENLHATRRLARLDEFRCRRERDYAARKAADPHFTLTAIQETTIEVSELWGLSPGKIRNDLDNARTLKEHFPGVWQLCLHGQLDLYKASIVAETARFRLRKPQEYAALAHRLTAWLSRGIRSDVGPPLVNRTVKQLRNKLTYEVHRIRQRDSDERFKQAFTDRSVRARMDEDGMGSLCVSGSVTEIQLADYRLSLIAKSLRSAGDERTLDQLRADLAIDLILGRAEVNATIRELEDAGTGEPMRFGSAYRRLPTSDYARPIINVTVPLQTLMGTADEPGVLSGGAVIPAALARLVAQDPHSTWYRMLTDPHGECLELSTKSYRPTKPIWRDVVARYRSCFRRNCDHPATTSELDHRTPWPRGETSTDNLAPACALDHKGKHAEGFGMSTNDDGTLTFTTRAGFAHPTEAVEHPASTEWPAEELLDSQLTASEVFEAIHYLRQQQDALDNNSWLRWSEENLRETYRDLYPDATPEDIDYWIQGDPGEPEEEHWAPPIRREADRLLGKDGIRSRQHGIHPELVSA